MNHLSAMKLALKKRPEGEYCNTDLIRYREFRNQYGKSALTAGAKALRSWFENFPVYIYEYDKIAGSRHGNFCRNVDSLELNRAQAIYGSYGRLAFWNNNDHYAPGYERFLREGICGTMARIE